ncbi:cysteine-rich and transmembrane domain-containing protein YDL012C-like [Ctenocephalides felis]|uniref:cysteine-rich and transmembrane domain-containing protein YDL012C-like n=1 Tax=Ctenocephalides felis TaxID=7515 RepID=UPI000E6E5315|nr:cysteine-rich and transmembrane domain-containing protein YDL012C-like [Ctenocephalides felis]
MTDQCDVSNSLQQQQPQPQYIQPQPKPSAAPSYAVPQRKNFYFINNASPAPVSEEPKEDYYQPKSQPQQQYYQPQQQYYQPQQQQYQEPEPQYYQQRASQQYYQPRQPVVVDMNQFRGHPASNFDLNTGSYSVNYSG